MGTLHFSFSVMWCVILASCALVYLGITMRPLSKSFHRRSVGYTPRTLSVCPILRIQNNSRASAVFLGHASNMTTPKFSGPILNMVG